MPLLLSICFPPLKRFLTGSCGLADVSGYSPARAQGVIAVGAMDRSNKVWTNSNHGSGVAMFAPGHEIPTPAINDRLLVDRQLPLDDDGLGLAPGFVLSSGTSFAASHVTGVMTLRLELEPEATPEQVSSCFTHVLALIGMMLPSAAICGALMSSRSPSPFIAMQVLQYLLDNAHMDTLDGSDLSPNVMLAFANESMSVDSKQQPPVSPDDVPVTVDEPESGIKALDQPLSASPVPLPPVILHELETATRKVSRCMQQQRSSATYPLVN